ncbi:hypothetical protein FIBSPDRAFT_939693 [Athelia psychrophila]|uniref:Uncharacterized protein n=1 Tax=Athelia psychrophila TaxID=1759441 RepID=A0A167XDV9_9AGAM|nr:hypothetical protein FIBSPDRAFT_939693 [Fibularhizoctonia sp. CBS 109695]
MTPAFQRFDNTVLKLAPEWLGQASNGNIFTVRDDLLQDIDEGKSGVPRAFVILRRQKFQCERRVMERREGVRHEIDSPRPPKAIDALSSETHLKGSEGDGDDDDDEQNIPITPPQGADVKMLSNEIISAVIADPPSVNPESSQEKSHHDSASSAKPILADQGVRPVYSQIWEWLLTVFELLLRSCKRVTLVETFTQIVSVDGNNFFYIPPVGLQSLAKRRYMEWRSSLQSAAVGMY